MKAPDIPPRPDSPAAAATAQWRTAAEAGDLERFLATLAPNAVFQSPLTTRTRFEGQEEIRVLMQAIFATIADIRYTVDVGDERVRALRYSARIGRQEVHEATLINLDDDALILEATFWFRPLPGLTALAAALGPTLARPRSRPRALLLTLLARPLHWLTRVGDPLGVWLAR